jgi:protein-disulfide isomerase
MKFPILLAATTLLVSATAPAAVTRHARVQAKHPPKTAAATKAEAAQPAKPFFHPGEVRSTGTLTVGGQPISYGAFAGTLVVHAKVDGTPMLGPTTTPTPTQRTSTRGAQARSVDVLHGLFQTGRQPQADPSPSCSTRTRPSTV